MGFYEDIDEQKQFACRVIADHARTTAFAIADGILPGNEGRNYVLRKIMRRAIYHGREHLGFNDLFFHKVCDFVVGEMKEAYPELEVQRDFIGKMVRLEEERFGNTLTVGLKKIEDATATLKHSLDKFEDAFDELIRNPEIADQEYWNVFFDGFKSGDSVEDIADKAKSIYKEILDRYPNNPLHEFVKLIYMFRIPPYLLGAIVPRLNKKYPDLQNRLGYFLRSIEKSEVDFEQTLAGELFNFVNSLPESNERKLIVKFIFDRFNGIVPINIYNEMMFSNREDANAFLQKLDLHLAGTTDEPFINFVDLAKFKDTYGTPPDLIWLKLSEMGIEFSEEGFYRRFNDAVAYLQDESDIGKTERKSAISPIYQEMAEKTGASVFHGYDLTAVENSKVVAIIKNDKQIESLNEGEEGLIVLNETPFYAEAGGQVGDTGQIVRTACGSGRLNGDGSGDRKVSNELGVEVKPSSTADGTDSSANIRVLDTFAPTPGLILHKSKVQSGSIKVGDTVTATVDVAKRDATRRNHTATHLVHAALKEVLGTHVKQGGSVVAPNYLRFDYTHYQPLTPDEIREIEDLVNRYILQNEPVTTSVMAIEEAMRCGAVALFGEKYGSDVRVLSVGGGEFSKELCGGTHVRATGDIGSFKITSDESVASGLRRIRAITGLDAFERFREDEKLIDEALGHLKTQRDQLPNAVEKLQEELKKVRKENDELKMKIATGAIGSASSNGDEAKEIKGVKVVAKIVDGLDKGGMRHLSDTLLAKMKSGVVVLARTEDDKVSFIVRVSDDLTDRVKAGKIVQEIAPIVGGRGGGKPDMAEGGGTDTSKLNEALEASYNSVETMLG